MKYDFTTVLNRCGQDSIAANTIPFADVQVEEGFSTIPMWVADMSFVTAPPVLEAIRRRLDFPSMGYFAESEEYYQSILRWQAEKNGLSDLSPECIGYENGVLGGISAAVQAFSSVGESVLLHAPCYVGFLKTLKPLGRTPVFSTLVKDEQGVWRMDYADMDKKLRENHIRLAIFCSPHNPSGRVWERWEIEKAMEVYAKNDCLVIADEIWADLIMPGYTHIPSQSVSEDAKNRTVAFYAPSKTFNIAGLVGAYHIVYNETLRERMGHMSLSSHYNNCNVLSMHALIGGYSPEGRQWVDECCQVIQENFRTLCDYLDTVEGLRFMRPQGTYILYVDCADWCKAHGVSLRELQLRGVRKGVIWQDGEPFQMPDTIRINLSLPTSQVEEVIRRLKAHVFI